MTLENLTEACYALFGIWLLWLVVDSGCRFARQAVSNLLRGRRIGDWLFQPVVAARLPARTAKHFDVYTPYIQALGFEPVDDYRLRYHPGPAFARYLIAADGRSFGEISDSLGSLSYSFFSLFGDGAYLETSAAQPLYGPPEAPRLVLHCHGDATVAELYARHLEHIQTLQASQGSSVLELTAADLDEAANYGRRLVRSAGFLRSRRVEVPDFVGLQSSRRAQAR